MATLDSPNNFKQYCGSKTVENVYLKFWQWDPAAARYHLSTRIDQPHVGPITGLEFSPSNNSANDASASSMLLLATSSSDGNFKIWQMSSADVVENSPKSTLVWKCRSSGFWQRLPAGPISFSHDGSILAVAYAHSISLWDPLSLTLMKVLHQPSNTIVNLQFSHSSMAPSSTSSFETDTSDIPLVGNSINNASSNDHFLLAGGHDSINVWNILTCKMEWQLFNFTARKIILQPLTGNFVVEMVREKSRYSQNVLICVFNPRSPVPLFTSILPATLGLQLLPCAPLSHSKNPKHLNVVLLNEQKTIELHSTLTSTDRNPLTATVTPHHDSLGQFSSIFGSHSQHANPLEVEMLSAPLKLSNSSMSVLGVAAHCMPSVTKLFDDFMVTLALDDSRKNPSIEQQQNDTVSNKDASDEAPLVATLPARRKKSIKKINIDSLVSLFREHNK